MLDKFTWISGQPLALGVILVLGISIAIFLTCMLIDLVRLMIFNACKIKRLCEVIEGGLNKALNLVFKQ